MKINKEDIINIAQSMGFELNYDQFEIPHKEWLRFVYNNARNLDEPDLRWIWYKDMSMFENLKKGSNILFKLGQKAKIQQLNTYIDL